MRWPASPSAARLVLTGLIALTAAERAWLLHVFAFRHIGIDDALIMQVARDYSQGLFREPYLYGQNYNPMLEALLAAPFVGLGAAPWIALPIVTALLALLPFWSWSIWALRKGWGASALAVAALPLALPAEWGMITSMPRGWVHGLALLAVIPWAMDIRRPWPRHMALGLTTVAALLLNPNALPLAAALAAWLALREGRLPSLWMAGAAALGLGYAAHRGAQAWYASRPGTVMHPLLPEDLAYDSGLLAKGMAGLDAHLLHLHPFGGMGWLALALLLAATALLASRRQVNAAAALAIGTAALLLALGVPKVHEGCASVFFPQSRMMLALPLLMAAAAAALLHQVRMPVWAGPAVLAAGIAAAGAKAIRLDEVVRHELAHQQCAWVREAPIHRVRDLCGRVKHAAQAAGARVVVPIRWPSIRDDHEAHFRAHLVCYACEALEAGFLPTYGAGYDRRSWRRSAHEAPQDAAVLYVGGRPDAWERAIAGGINAQRISDDSLLLHAVAGDRRTVSEFLIATGADDELGR